MSVFSACFGSSKAEKEPEIDSTSSEAPVESEEDELTKQEKKLTQAKQVFKEKSKHVDALFKLQKKHLDSKLKPPSEPRGRGLVLGPNEGNLVEGIEDVIFAKSISIYPKKPAKAGEPQSKERLGDPICDCFAFDVFADGQAIVAAADGCNWGTKPLEAARIACEAFHSYTREHLVDFVTIRDAGRLLVKAFCHAHVSILQAPLKRGVYDIWETGTTTLLGGALLALDDESAQKLGAPWVFLCATVGDCKAFHCSAETGEISDITVGTRPPSPVTNVNDPGGRLGPYVGKEGSADLRNLALFYVPCKKGDIVLLLSDGVYDNLDPQQLGVPTADVGVGAPSWEEASAEEAERAKDAYRCTLIANKIREVAGGHGNGRNKGGKDKEKEDSAGSGGEDKGKKTAAKKSKGKTKAKDGRQEVEEQGESFRSGGGAAGAVASIGLDALGDGLLDYSKQVTKYSRKWMEEHPTARMPDARSKKKDPAMLGKMDHTTCVALRVGFAFKEGGGPSGAARDEASSSSSSEE